jgi:hypothetical protein
LQSKFNNLINNGLHAYIACNVEFIQHAAPPVAVSFRKPDLDGGYFSFAAAEAENQENFDEKILNFCVMKRRAKC